MKQLDPAVLWAVFVEMMGPVLWLLIALAAIGILGFLFVLQRDGRLVSSRLVKAELIGFFGGFVALAITAWVTVSGFSDAGGPIDWLMIAIIWGIGLVGFTILAYTGLSLLVPSTDDKRV